MGPKLAHLVSEGAGRERARARELGSAQTAKAM